ncbi:MAG: MoaD family protein [Candidatus Thorarchaeota archaeon]|nr:MAG: MoaD family protein [Candidatus Thorarchaeota archaeon]
MKVTVKFFAHLRDLVGKKSTIEVDLEEGATVSRLMAELCMDEQVRATLLDENRELKSDITILKNGREIRFLEGMDTKLESGDEISVFPVVAGGNQTD